MIALELLKRENAKREKYLKQQKVINRKVDMRARNIAVVEEPVLCTLHPKYKAVRPPTAECAQCRAAYIFHNTDR